MFGLIVNINIIISGSPTFFEEYSLKLSGFVLLFAAVQMIWW